MKVLCENFTVLVSSNSYTNKWPGDAIRTSFKKMLDNARKET